MAQYDGKIELSELKRQLNYDQTTGKFTWKVAKKSFSDIGKEAGWLHKIFGYRIIKVNQYPFRAGRLVWFYMTATWPTDEIDHINGKRDDDRFCNLRDVTHAINTQNKRKAQSSNKLGIQGVRWRNGAFETGLKLNGEKIAIGRYKTPEEAHEAYLVAKRKHHIGCTI